MSTEGGVITRWGIRLKGCLPVRYRYSYDCQCCAAAPSLRGPEAQSGSLKMTVRRRRWVSKRVLGALPRVSRDDVGSLLGSQMVQSLLSAVRGCPSAGRFSARLAGGEDRTRRAARLVRWMLRRLPCVGEQTVRVLLLWCLAAVRVGGERAAALGDWLSTRSRRISLVRCSLALAATHAMAKAARIKSFSTST